MKNINIEVGINPEVKKTINDVCSNIEQINKLLKQNKKLLAKVFQSSLEIVEAPLESPQVVSTEADRKPT